MKRYITAFMAFLFVAILLSACTPAPENPATFSPVPENPYGEEQGKKEDEKEGEGKKLYTLLLSHSFSTDHPFNTGMKRIADKVYDLSGGQLEISVFSSSQLVNPDDTFNLLSQGKIDIAILPLSDLSYHDGSFGVFDMPYVIEDLSAIDSVLFSEPMQAPLLELQKNFSIDCLSLLYIGSYHITSAGEAISSFEDLRELPYYPMLYSSDISTLSALGGAVSVQSSSSAYLALKSGEATFFEGSLASVYANRIYEVQGFLNLTRHKTVLAGLCVYSGLESKLTPELYSLLYSVIADEVPKINEEVALSETHTLELIESTGMVVITPDDFTPFYEAAKRVALEEEARGYLPTGIYQKLIDLYK